MTSQPGDPFYASRIYTDQMGTGRWFTNPTLAKWLIRFFKDT